MNTTEGFYLEALADSNARTVKAAIRRATKDIE